MPTLLNVIKDTHGHVWQNMAGIMRMHFMGKPWMELAELTLFTLNLSRKAWNIFACSIISHLWGGAGSCNLSSWKKRTHFSNRVNNITADDLVIGHQQPWCWHILLEYSDFSTMRVHISNNPTYHLCAKNIYSGHTIHSLPQGSRASSVMVLRNPPQIFWFNHPMG